MSVHIGAVVTAVPPTYLVEFTNPSNANDLNPATFADATFIVAPTTGYVPYQGGLLIRDFSSGLGATPRICTVQTRYNLAGTGTGVASAVVNLDWTQNGGVSWSNLASYFLTSPDTGDVGGAVSFQTPIDPTLVGMRFTVSAVVNFIGNIGNVSSINLVLKVYSIELSLEEQVAPASMMGFL
jgi:hypothetical protein